MPMSRQETFAWFVLLGSLLGLAYFGVRLSDPALGALPADELRAALHRSAVMAVVMWVTLAAMTFASRLQGEDERDIAIRHRAGGLAYGFLLACLVVATLALGFGQRAFVPSIDAIPAAHVLLLMLLGAAFVQSLAQVALYRRDAR